MAAIRVERTFAQLKEHYDVERELADRLRKATRSERRSLYNIVYDERCERIPHHPLLTQAADPTARHAAVVPQLRLLRSLIKPETIFLEVGPGDCALAIEVARIAKHVYAVDVSEALVQDVALPANFQLMISDGIDIPVPQNVVDLAYSNQVMEHLHPEDAYDQLRSIYTTLVPGGSYICITPNPLSGPHDISRHFDDVATGFHLREYTISELSSVMKQAGFSKTSAMLSYKGYVLSPRLPIAPFIAIESVVSKLPRTLRKKIAHVLTAVKVVATK
jgi:SAM-dependent methyltransferase